MKFNFDPNLSFQLQAMQSVIQVFDGSKKTSRTVQAALEFGTNSLHISPDQFRDNIKKVMKDNGIGKSTQNLQKNKNDLLELSIEMETGTGKTYVYLRTICELYKIYGLTKFIILTPSIPVREGVLKTSEYVQQHFKELYNVRFTPFVYDSKRLNQVRNFAFSKDLEIMVMNIQSFNSDERIINQERDTNNGYTAFEMIKGVKPIIIMDEPQEGMDAENTFQRITSFEPLFTLRYSATHKEAKNLIYRLSPYDAYKQNLVKKIEVFSIHESNTQSNVHIHFKEFKAQAGKDPQAKLELQGKVVDGFKIKDYWIKAGDDLEEKTDNPVYRGWIVERIHKSMLSGAEKILFSNDKELISGQLHGFSKEDIFRSQIHWTIRSHFTKKARLAPMGIKVLSLFFIDRVANYTESDGLVRKLFVEEYIKIYQELFGTRAENIESVHNGYFAKISGDYTDNAAAMQRNKEAYDMILKDKTKLLDMQEPLSFIFSHSALGVGWDNPNVFQICTLNESISPIRKRQEIGRGLRIAVNSSGERVFDSTDIESGKEINVLTVVANLTYQAFASHYQEELRNDEGESAMVPTVENARNKVVKNNLRKDNLQSELFKQLWSRLESKTEFRLMFDEDTLIEKCSQSLSALVIKRNVVSIEVNRIDLSLEGEISGLGVGQEEMKVHGDLGNLDLFNELQKETTLSSMTLAKILQGVTDFAPFIRNPVLYVYEASKKIKEIMDEQLLAIRYYKSGEKFPLSEFKEMYDVAVSKSKKLKNGLYEYAETDSDIEKSFVSEMNLQSNKIRLAFKLPKWYKIATPIGNYNPDWALVVEYKPMISEDAIYNFVVETKGVDNLQDLTYDERFKIQCAIKHFEAIGFVHYVAPVKDFRAFEKKAEIVTDVNLFN